MFDRFIRLAEARRALARGHFEQVLQLVEDPVVREHRRAVELRDRALRGLLTRARRRQKEGVLAGATLSRPTILSAAELAVILLVGAAILVWRPYRKPWRLAALLLGPAAALAATSWGLFHGAGLLFDPVYPAMATAAVPGAGRVS